MAFSFYSCRLFLRLTALTGGMAFFYGCVFIVGDRPMPNVTYERDGSRPGVGFQTVGESMTEQGHGKAANINSIMAKYHMSGLVPRPAQAPIYGDFCDVGSFLECKERLENTISDFQSLPAALRKRFDNDPAELIEFLCDRENLQEAVQLGLVENPSSPPPPPR